MAEAQLIGRGARYFPFFTKELPDVAPEKRKFDRNLAHPLRILEELYYHCSHNPRYITEISNALKKTGMLDENESKRELKLKNNFRQSNLYKKGYVWVNKRDKNRRENVTGLADYNVDMYYTHPHLMTGLITENSVFDRNPLARGNKDLPVFSSITRIFSMADLGLHILRFALDSNKFFHFVNLRTYFPNLTGISMFLESKSYLGNVKVIVRGQEQEIDNLTPHKKLEITQHFLQKIENRIRHEAVEYIGTEKFFARKISDYFTDRIIKLKVEGEASRSWTESEIEGLEKINLKTMDWHAYEDCYGTKQEKKFVKFINDHITRFQEIYEDFYLLRNEKAVKIYSFEDGQAFEPDYVLFLKRKGEDKAIIFQLYIEPKGEHLIEHDRWKESFLEEIREKIEVETIIQGKKYAVFGLPFYNDTEPINTKFREAFNDFLTNNK